MKRCSAVVGAMVLSLGLVVGCQSGGSNQTRNTTGVDFGRSDGGQVGAREVDVDEWHEAYLAALGAITTVHIVIDQDLHVAGEKLTTHLEIDLDIVAGAGVVRGNQLGEPVTTVIIDGRVYHDADGVTAEGTLQEMGMSPGDMNPASDIERQRPAVTKVELVGPERVAALETTRYTITYDVAEMNKLLDDNDIGGHVTGDTATADVWLDDQMRPIKYESTLLVEAEGHR
ncbi:MAG: hypothetical protein FWE61_10470, partial [Micrococcales bacterium]|nr:hypothetical protein [Micrococcales bacterium]